MKEKKHAALSLIFWWTRGERIQRHQLCTVYGEPRNKTAYNVCGGGVRLSACIIHTNTHL